MTFIPEPSVLLGVLVAAWLYGRGVRAVWINAGRERVVKTWQVAAFGAGLLGLLIALEWPLDAWSAELFAAHMVQHLLLLVLVGPLLVLGAPLVPLLWSIPAASRRGLGGWWKRARWLRNTWHVISQPAVAFALHSIALWAWHAPTLYEAALSSRGVHILEHVCFLGTALLFWFALLRGGRVGYGAGVLYVFGLALQSTLLGALLTFARQPWYATHTVTAPAWGLTALEDQQLAGLIMWLPGGSLYLAGALALFAAWLRSSSPPAHTPGRAPRTPAGR